MSHLIEGVFCRIFYISLYFIVILLDGGLSKYKKKFYFYWKWRLEIHCYVICTTYENVQYYLKTVGLFKNVYYKP